jgi:uncharacterized protein YcbX
VGADDDADCVEHVYDLDEIHLGGAGADVVKSCTRCGAPTYVADRPGQEAARARLL